MEHQHTIARAVSTEGIGLHTGVNVKVRLLPAPAGTGIIFKRTDLDGFVIEAKAANVARLSYATSLMKKGVLISTVEHLLSALAALRVDNAMVEIDNLELPIMDGSSLPFVRMIQEAGLRRQRARRVYARIKRPVEVVEDSKRIAISPAETFQLTYRINFNHPMIGEQLFAFGEDAELYRREVAPARTFGFLEEVEMLRKSGLVRGGSLENAIVLTRDGVMNPEGLRFPDEFCRHKALDLIGDLSLLGYPLIGHVSADCAGHAMHFALIKRLLREKSAWEITRAGAPAEKSASPAEPAVVTANV